LLNNLNIAFRILIIFGLSFLWRPGLTVTAQTLNNEPAGEGFSVSFIKSDINQKAGQLSFNILRVINHSDSAVRFKPFLVLPTDWSLFSLPYNDTVVNPHDSISLIYRFKLPEQVSSELKYEVFFRAYSMQNQLLAEDVCNVFPEPIHNWEVVFPDKRIFFAPRKELTDFSLKLENKGNTQESIDLVLTYDKKIELNSTGDWQPATGD